MRDNGDIDYTIDEGKLRVDQLIHRLDTMSNLVLNVFYLIRAVAIMIAINIAISIISMITHL